MDCEDISAGGTTKSAILESDSMLPDTQVKENGEELYYHKSSSKESTYPGPGRDQETQLGHHIKVHSFECLPVHYLDAYNIASIPQSFSSHYDRIITAGYNDHSSPKQVPQDFEYSRPTGDIQAIEQNVGTSVLGYVDSVLSHTQSFSALLSPNSPFANITSESSVQMSKNDFSNQNIPYNQLTCRERKRIIVSFNRPQRLTTSMKLWVSKTHALLDPFREDDACWFHPSPPPARVGVNGTLRPYGKLQKSFSWQDRKGKHSIVLNYGVVSKLVFHKMTKQQKDGFINKQWHLSHLCGNWTCLNSAHTTVEPGSVNISRNNCFSHRSGCSHTPPCMKDRKVSLGADGKPVNHSLHNEGLMKGKVVDDWDDWTPHFDDGEDSMNPDHSEEPSLMAQYLGDVTVISLI